MMTIFLFMIIKAKKKYIINMYLNKTKNKTMIKKNVEVKMKLRKKTLLQKEI